ncbi:MAG: hypothetical protein ACXWEA_08430 [Solirubrobacterales bacterium]
MELDEKLALIDHPQRRPDREAVRGRALGRRRDQAPERDQKPAPPRRHKHDDVSL